MKKSTETLPVWSVVCHGLKVEEIKIFELCERFFVAVKYSTCSDVELSKVLNLLISSVIIEKKQSTFCWTIGYKKDNFSGRLFIRCFNQKMFFSNQRLHARKYLELFIDIFLQRQLFNLHVKLFFLDRVETIIELN